MKKKTKKGMNNSKKWTEEDDAELSSLYTSGLSFKQIAKELKRTAPGVRIRVNKTLKNKRKTANVRVGTVINATHSTIEKLNLKKLVSYRVTRRELIESIKKMKEVLEHEREHHKICSICNNQKIIIVCVNEVVEYNPGSWHSYARVTTSRRQVLDKCPACEHESSDINDNYIHTNTEIVR